MEMEGKVGIRRLAAATIVAGSVTLAPAPASAESLSGNWRGTYDCGGLSYDLGLQLVQEKTRVYGILRFAAPDGTRGAFRVFGWHSMIGEIRLNPGDWIDQPPGYFKAALFGETQGKNRLIGGVEADGCGGFHADRE
jgi:hypothetical protein